ncbi:methyltransferase [Candidatus Magnetomonas plexicatena]|uniref:methyltransferase n=1 Tax=Candidatus Magnetomonas plexicatena TaxID=2552947 RepID=UPI001C740D55|nr:methyltransferase domain-containing protein [Nitrospirales bacterium LBB_01]
MSDILKLKNLMWGYSKSKVLFTANNLKVFDYLKKPKSAKSLASKLDTDLRATTILLDALTALEFLQKDEDFRYVNSPFAMEYLISSSPLYQGDIISHSDTLWKNWSGLDEIMKTGKPYRSARNHDSFIRAMHNISIIKVKDVIDCIDLTGVKLAIDIGGGPGTYTIELAKRGVETTLFDRADTIVIAKEFVKKSRRKNVKYIEGDFTTDSFGGKYDLAFISQVFHSYSVKESLTLIRKIKKALNKNGIIAIQEFLIEDNLASPLDGAMFAVNMLVNSDNGRCYSVNEMSSWLKKCGFSDVTVKHVNDSVIVCARLS